MHSSTGKNTKEAIYRSTPVDTSMSHAEREKHRLYLEAHPIEWIKFFFPGYAKYEFADFQKRAIRRILAHDEWYEVLSWSRELAKSTITMFVVLLHGTHREEAQYTPHVQLQGQCRPSPRSLSCQPRSQCTHRGILWQAALTRQLD